MNKLKTAVIGLGGIEQMMLLPHMLKMKDVEITAVSDIDFGKDSLRFINIKL